jgi:fructose-1,6-bisphosphatase/inositol monophosphatase family enzyme
MAAGIVLIREAGGYVTDHLGGDAMFETSSIVAANGDIIKQLAPLLSGCG